MERGMELEYLGWAILALITLGLVLYSFNPRALSAIADFFTQQRFG